jgi:hypothetical protein
VTVREMVTLLHMTEYRLRDVLHFMMTPLNRPNQQPRIPINLMMGSVIVFVQFLISIVHQQQLFQNHFPLLDLVRWSPFLTIICIMN